MVLDQVRFRSGQAELKMLHIVMYHYVRDLERTRYPRIKGMLLSDFEQQVRSLAGEFEMASLESALSYLGGGYRPRRELCLLTFDDGLKEHYQEVTPILSGLGIQGIFHVVTACLEDRVVVPVHMNHFLMAALDFNEYRRAFLDGLGELDPAAWVQASSVNPDIARKTYVWDTLDVALFKYFFNFNMDPSLRDSIVGRLFERYIGSERAFAEELYMSWADARTMQAAGMSIGGHTHRHRALATFTNDELQADLETSAELLHRHLAPQALWPFCYPYGKRDSFPAAAMGLLERLGFACAFTTEKGPNGPGQNLFTIGRVDCKTAPVYAGSGARGVA